MKWIKFSRKFPNFGDNVKFLVTDGKEVWVMYEDHRELWFVSEVNENMDQVRDRLTHWSLLENLPLPNQPERSKREESQKCDMRCSEHCGNTVSHK